MTSQSLAREDRELLLDGVRSFARQELLPAAPLLDAGDPDVRERCWRQICELGLDRALLDAEAGGDELPPGAWLSVIEELAVADGGLALAVALHTLALLALAPAQAAALAPGCRWVLAALDDAGDPRLTLGADGAGGLVLLPSDPQGAVSVAGAGWSVDPDEHQLGLRGAPAGVVRVRELSGLPDARTAELHVLLFAAAAAVSTGIARRAYELAVDYAAFRRQGGGAIGRYGAVRQMLAAMAARLHARPRMPFDEDSPDRMACALAAKVLAGEAAGETTIDAVQVFGGSGYVEESGAEKLMRDARCCRAFPEPLWRTRARLIALEGRLPAAE